MSSCQHPKWFSCLENQTIKHFHRDIYPTNLQHILLKKSLFLAPEFSLVDSGNISVWATQHWCWPYTKPWEISSPPCWRCLGSRWRISRIQEIIQDGPSFRLGKQAILEGKQAILEVWGVVLFFLFGIKRFAYESRGIIPFLGATCYIGFESGGLWGCTSFHVQEWYNLYYLSRFWCSRVKGPSLLLVLGGELWASKECFWMPLIEYRSMQYIRVSYIYRYVYHTLFLSRHLEVWQPHVYQSKIDD